MPVPRYTLSLHSLRLVLSRLCALILDLVAEGLRPALSLVSFQTQSQTLAAATAAEPYGLGTGINAESLARLNIRR